MTTKRRWRYPIVALVLLFLGLGQAPPGPGQADPGRPLPPPPDLGAVPRIASYDIEVTLDPASARLTGRERIAYWNNSAGPIPDLLFHLYLNAFRDENSYFLRQGSDLRGFRWDPAAPGWIQVDELRLADGPVLTLDLLADDTLARAPLPRPILPGETLIVEVAFTAQLPRVFARTGFAGDQDGTPDFFMVGQWFPKLGVWQTPAPETGDPTAGAWNAYPFHANNEFFADFGLYDVRITLPDHFRLGASGDLLRQTGLGDGRQTWHFRADPVIDFAWAASSRFLTTSRVVDETEIVYLYLPEHEWSVDRALDAAAAALSHFNRWYGRYPYSRLTVVDVPDDGGGAGGMEYPTLVTAGTLDPTGLGLTSLGRDRTLEAVIIHEVAHQWWQSMVAFNEVEEPWLDEGLADYSTLRLLEILYDPAASMLDTGLVDVGYRDGRRAEFLAAPAVPMLGRADALEGFEYGVAAYAKPALALTTLEAVLGEGPMLTIMQRFFRQFGFTHPTTADFETTAEAVAGQPLTWFFDGLVYGQAVVNYVLADLTSDSVTVVRQGELAIPTEVLVTFADGTEVRETWDGRDRRLTLRYEDRPAVVAAEIDPERRLLVELRWSDNGRRRSPDLPGWLALVSRLLYRLQDALLLLGGL